MSVTISLFQTFALPLRARLLMRRAADPLRCRAALAQMYGYWEP